MTKSPIAPQIQWHEGMLLSPQHFQQSELRYQQTLTYHLHRLSPFYWGIHHLKFDPVVLSGGLIRLLELDAVMPDGLIVYRHSDSEAPLELDVTPLKDTLAKEETTIYLVVPERSTTSSPIIGDWPRFTSIEGEEIIDENASDNVIRIPRLMPKLGLLAGSVPPARYEYIPIARLIYQDEAYLLTPYIPPCFYVHPNSPLHDRCAALTMKIREKSSYLAEKWQSQIGTELLRETSELSRPLVECLPLLEAIVSTGKTHPYDLYLTLCMVAGRFATLRLNQVMPTFPPYHHNEILRSMSPLLDWLEKIVSSIERTYTIIPFLQNDRLFYHKLARMWTEEELLIGVRVPPTMDSAEMMEWVRESIISSESHLESARMRRVTGAPRHAIDPEEMADLMPGSGLQLYRIQMDPHYITPGENLMIFHAADEPEKRPVGIVLYVKGPHPQEDEETEQEG